MKIAELHFNEEGDIIFTKEFKRAFDLDQVEFNQILIADIFGDFLKITERLYYEHLFLRKQKYNKIKWK